MDKMTWAALLIALALTVALGLAMPRLGAAAEPVDLNTATVRELMQLPGLGPRKAEEILRFRLIRGFRRPRDLLRVKGIGRRTYLKLKPLIEVRPPSTQGAEQAGGPPGERTSSGRSKPALLGRGVAPARGVASSPASAEAAGLR